MRITIAISSMGGGGAERVTSVLSNRWARAGHAVTIVTMSDLATDFYALDPRITRIALGLVRRSETIVAAVANNLNRIRALRRAVLAGAPDVVISFMTSTSVLTLLALAGTGIPVIVTERTDPAGWSTEQAWAALRRLSYSRAAAIVVQTQRVATWARRRWGRPVVVIPNPLDPAFLAPATGTRERLVVGAGRLIREKRFDLLVGAFDAVAARHDGWSLAIAGEGPLEAELRAQVQRVPCSGRITLLGCLRDVRSLFEKASIFVLTSDVEGFPNALIEAMATGCAAISTDCPSGPGEIVESNVDGLIVPPNSRAHIALALDELMSNETRRAEIAGRGRASANRFSADIVGGHWDSLLDRVASPDLAVPVPIAQ
jgi:glycosyltransferase involved in cell wall biosynthesis